MPLVSRFITTSLSIFYVISNKMKMTALRLFASKASEVLEFRESSETLKSYDFLFGIFLSLMSVSPLLKQIPM